MSEPATIRNRLLAVIVVVLAVAGLRASYSVTMPIAVAMVIIAAAWPIKPFLDRALPSSLSYVGTLVALLLISAAFAAGIYFSSAQVVQVFLANQDRFRDLYGSASSWLQQHGLPSIGDRREYNRLIGVVAGLLSTSYTTFAYLGYVAVLVVLGLPEVPHFRDKIRREFGTADRRELLDTVDEIGDKIRQYVGVTTLASIITGVGSALLAVAFGLDLAFVWGVLNFLLNYVPVIGNIIGIIPPSLFAVVQFGGWQWPLVIFAAYAVLQIAISNFLYPWLQGRSLALSPVAVVVALTFWGWVWGIAGALIAIPLTVTLMIACAHFPSTKWIATLLASKRP
jgi:predicted PurR-regulated permease PerM